MALLPRQHLRGCAMRCAVGRKMAYADLELSLRRWRGDGALDLVFGNYGAQSAIYLNDGGGGFSEPGPSFGGTSYTTGVAVGDFNSDGALDVAASNWYGQPSFVHLNDGTGNFVVSRSLGDGLLGTSVAAGD